MGDAVSKSELREGLSVRAANGRSLGRVVAVERGRFVVERGFFFPREFSLDLDAVSEVRGEEAILAPGAEAAFGLRVAEPQRAAPVSRRRRAEKSGAYRLHRLELDGTLEDEDEEDSDESLDDEEGRHPHAAAEEEPGSERKLRFG